MSNEQPRDFGALCPVNDGYNVVEHTLPAAILNPEADAHALVSAALLRVELVERFARSLGVAIHESNADMSAITAAGLEMIDRVAEEARLMLGRAQSIVAAPQSTRHANAAT